MLCLRLCHSFRVVPCPLPSCFNLWICNWFCQQWAVGLEWSDSFHNIRVQMHSERQTHTVKGHLVPDGGGALGRHPHQFPKDFQRKRPQRVTLRAWDGWHSLMSCVAVFRPVASMAWESRAQWIMYLTFSTWYVKIQVRTPWTSGEGMSPQGAMWTMQSTEFNFSCSVLSDSLRPHGLQHARLPVHHQLPGFTQTHVHWVNDAIQSSHPLSSPSPPAFNLSQNQGLFQQVSSSHQVAKILEFQLQHQSLQWIFRTDFL